MTTENACTTNNLTIAQGATVTAHSLLVPATSLQGACRIRNFPLSLAIGHRGVVSMPFAFALIDVP
jgi:hypothetical protein